MIKLLLFSLRIARGLAGRPDYFLEGDMPEGGREGGREKRV